MLEVMIEQWRNADGTTDFLWSAWQNGQRVQMGGPRDSADAAEREAVAWCLRGLGARPDEVTRL